MRTQVRGNKDIRSAEDGHLRHLPCNIDLRQANYRNRKLIAAKKTRRYTRRGK